MPVIPVLGRRAQEDGEFEVGLNCRARIYVKEKVMKILTQRLSL